MEPSILKQMYSVSEIFAKYGVQVNKNKVVCPFHKEKTASLVIGTDWFHCYGCGKHGDIFSIVQYFENCNFPKAVELLSGNVEVSYKAKRKAIEAQRQVADKVKYEDERFELLHQWAKLDKNKIDYAPKTHTDELHPLFVEALHKMPYLEYLMEEK